MMDRVMLMFLAILYWKSCIIQGFGPTEVEEDKPTRIPFVTSAEKPYIRYWYRGDGYDENHPPKATDLLFILIHGTGSDWNNGSAAHDDMFADPSDFSLTINKTRLEDNGFFTCKTFDANTIKDTYDVAGELQVYIQPSAPQLATSPSDLNNLKEGQTFTVTCTIDRLYPNVTKNELTMASGRGTICPGTAGCTFTPAAIPGDLAMQYTLEYTKTLASSDNGADIRCTINPLKGTEKTTPPIVLQVKYGPQKKPSITVDNDNPYQYTDVTFTCGVEGIDANPEINEVKWKIGNTEKGHNGKELVITDVRTTDSGEYKCIVRNGIGSGKESDSKTLNVRDEYAPRNSPELKIDKDYTHQYENVTFTCDTSGVKSNPHVDRFIWTKDGVDQPETVLEFTRTVMHEDTGGYMCSVGNGIGNPQLSAFVNLNVSKKYGPRFPPSLLVSKETPNRYDNVTFTCNYEGVDADPEIDSIEWTKDGRLCTDWSGAAEKTIYHVNGQNNGTYSCFVGNGIRSRRSEFLTFIVNSQYSPQNTPTLQIDNSNTAQFENITFNCLIGIVHSEPEVTLVNWTRNGEPLNDWPENELNVSRVVNQNDTGYYSCSLGNMIGYSTYSPTIHLNVSEQYRPDRAPSLDVDDPNPYSFEKVTFTCDYSQIKAEPKVSSFEWMINGTTKIDCSDPAYTINEVQVADNGDYSCKAVNTVGPSVDGAAMKLNVSALYKPHGILEILVNPKDAKRSEEVTFTCNIDGMQANPPELNVTWMKDDGILSDWPCLEFEHKILASKLENGTYKCTVNNKIGELRSNGVKFTVSEFYKPRDKPVLLVDNPTPLEEELVEFTCKVVGIDARPQPHVVWYMNGEYIGWEDEITRHVVKVEDTGNYTCRAENFVGLSPPSNAVMLQVKGKPSSPVPIIVGVVMAVVVIAVIIVAVIVIKKRRTAKPGSRNPRRDETDMSYNPSDNFGNDNEGVEYSEIGAAGRGNPTPTPRKTLQDTPDLLPDNNYENHRADLPDYAEVNKQPRGGTGSTDGNDIPTYAEVNKPQGDIAEYAEVKKPPISKKPTVKAPPGTEGMIYAEGLWDGGKRQPVKTRQAPPKPAPAPKKQVEEPTEYAQIDYTKSANNKPSANF